MWPAVCPGKTGCMITNENAAKTMVHRPVLRDVSFTVGDGSITGFMGPYGAGKRTTMRTALRLAPPDSGRVQFDGHNYRDSAPASPSRQPARREVELVKVHGFLVAPDPHSITLEHRLFYCPLFCRDAKDTQRRGPEDHGLRTVELAAPRCGEYIASSRRIKKITP